MATTAAQIQAIYDNLMTTLALEQVYCATHGPKPTYSLDGESYQWSEWEEAALRKAEALRKQINAAQPYIIRSRGRA